MMRKHTSMKIKFISWCSFDWKMLTSQVTLKNPLPILCFNLDTLTFSLAVRISYYDFYFTGLLPNVHCQPIYTDDVT